MPEGPECTIIANDLNAIASNKVLTSVNVLSGRYTKAPLANLDKIVGANILGIRNKGKFIYWIFDNGFYLFSTLGMSGGYTLAKETHSRVAFLLDNSLEIYYNDVRNFGTLKVAEQAKLDKKLKEIGPDMLNSPCSYEEFDKIINNKRIATKNLACFLLDQKRLSGVGNIYKAEICYTAAIDPSRNLSSLSEAEKHRLYDACKVILKLALDCKGSSQKDYKDVQGKLGSFLFSYANVYRRQTDRKSNPVAQAELGDGRTTWWCPEVQK
jgi:formamidopyrimidine-DNA glycosylase